MQTADASRADWTYHWADVGEVRLHYVEAGSGPLVVVLHGFPDFWYSWRHQIPVLAAAGFHVVAPDMRGYNLSDKPVGVDAYRIERLTADVAGLIGALGADRATVVGHDWGGMVAWFFAMRYPKLLDRLVIVNAPHPARFIEGLTPGQMLRSAYALFFQLSRVPEWTLGAGDFALIRRSFRVVSTRDGAFTLADIDRSVQALRQPGALTGGLNYYRAFARRWPSPGRMLRDLRPIETPTLVVWGERDPFLRPELATPDTRWVPRARVEYLPDASHWVQIDRPRQVNRLLLDFLAAPESLVTRGSARDPARAGSAPHLGVAALPVVRSWDRWPDSLYPAPRRRLGQPRQRLRECITRNGSGADDTTVAGRGRYRRHLHRSPADR